MISRVSELWSPSQIGPAMQDDVGRLDELAVDLREVVGVVAVLAHVRPDARRDDVVDGADLVDRTPTRSRIPRGIASSPSVWLASGERLRVPLKITARRSSYGGGRVGLLVDEALDVRWNFHAEKSRACAEYYNGRHIV